MNLKDGWKPRAAKPREGRRGGPWVRRTLVAGLVLIAVLAGVTAVQRVDKLDEARRALYVSSAVNNHQSVVGAALAHLKSPEAKPSSRWLDEHARIALATHGRLSVWVLPVAPPGLVQEWELAARSVQAVLSRLASSREYPTAAQRVEAQSKLTGLLDVLGRVETAARDLGQRASGTLETSKKWIRTLGWIVFAALLCLAWLALRTRGSVAAIAARANPTRPGPGSVLQPAVRAVVDQIPEPVLLLDPWNATISYVNPAAVEVLGRPTRALEGKPLADCLLAPSDGGVLFSPPPREAGRALVRLASSEDEVPHVWISTRPVKVQGRPLLWAQLTPQETDATRNALKDSESRFQILAESIPGAAYLLVRRGRKWEVAYLSSYIKQMLGREATAIGRRWDHIDALTHPDDLTDLRTSRAAALAARQPYLLSYRLRHADDSYRYVEEHGQGVYDDAGALRFLQGTVFDVTNRRRAREALAAEKDRLGVTLRSIADGVVSTNPEGIVELMNEAAEGLLGAPASQVVGRPLAAHWPVSCDESAVAPAPNLTAWLRGEGGKPQTETLTFRTPDGAELIVGVAGSPIRSLEGQTVGAVVVLRDVTEQQRREEEMQRAAKLESVGVLAGGIAHDFNNILAGVIGNLSLARMDVDGESEAAYSLKQAQDAAVRAQNLTRQLLTFAKGGAPLRRLTSLNECIRDTASFALRGSNVRCDPDIEDQLDTALVDEGQINQVLHNLVLNAAQAMPDGGTLVVTGRNVKVDDAMGLPVAPGPYIEITVTDEGCGMPEEVQRKIFDPYFTTKESGTGLGLATSYSIVRKHEGCISLDSEVGVGTTFRVYLPASTGRSAPGTPIAIESRAAASGPNRLGNVLLMDDELTVRDVCGRMLRSLGHTAAFAIDGEQALELYAHAQGKGHPFNLVIMDLTVPGAMGGREATARLLEMDPDARIVVSSGYSNDPVMADPRSFGFSGMLRKPYTQEDLAGVLADQLGTEPEVPPERAPPPSPAPIAPDTGGAAASGPGAGETVR